MAVAIAAAVWLLGVPAAVAQPPDVTPLRAPGVRIGCAPGTLVVEGTDRTAAFAEALRGDAELRAAAPEIASDIALTVASSFADFVRAAEAGRYDVILGPPTTLTQLERGAWSVVLQERREADIWDARAGGLGVQRQPILAARANLAAQWAKNPDAAWRRADGPLAVGLLGPESAEGHVAPMLHLASHGVDVERAAVSVLASEEDAFMALANGVIDVAAFTRPEFERLLARHHADAPEADAPSPVEVASLPPVPAPPVCVGRPFVNAHSAAGLKELTAALRRAADRATGGAVRFVPARDDLYDRLVEDAATWYERRGIVFGLRNAAIPR